MRGGRSRGRGVRAAGLVAATALLACCARHPEGSRLVFRFVPDDPLTVFSAQDLHENHEVFSWRFRNGGETAGEHGANFEPGLTPLARPIVPRAGIDPRLIHAVGRPASEFDAIEVDVSGPSTDRMQGPIRLFWRRPGEGWDTGRSIPAEAVRDVGRNRVTYTFPTGRHPKWKRRIQEVCLDLTAIAEDGVEVEAVRGVKGRATAARIAEASRRGWRISVADELRVGLLGPPGVPIERRLKVPPGSALRFAYAVQEGVRVPMRFTASVVDGPVLFEDTIQPGAGARGWREASAGLSSLMGREVTLRLTTVAGAGYDADDGLPVWGHPEVWAKTSEDVPPNVVVVSLDTLRADRLSLYGYSRPTSPHIDAWARRRGTAFLNTVAPSPWTLPSHASLFTGLDALHHGVNHGHPVPRQLTLMAERFREAGYATLGITGGAYLHSEYGFEQGFEAFRAWDSRLHPGEREFTAGVDLANRWIDAHKTRPFFLFLHTYAVHRPLEAIEPFFSRLTGMLPPTPDEFPIFESAPARQSGFLVERRFSRGGSPVTLAPAELQLLNGLYDSQVAYADAEVGRLLTALEAKGLLRRSIVVVTSDHGEALGEHGLAVHAYLYDFNLLVPLIVISPEGLGAGRTVGDQVRTVDILPTVLQLAGQPVPRGLDGASLVPFMNGTAAAGRDAWSYAASTNHGLSLRTADRAKYAYRNAPWLPPDGQELMYRLDSDRDETRNVAASDPLVPALRERTRREYETEANGLSVRFTNAGRRTFRVSLRVPDLGPRQVKSTIVPCSCVDWLEDGGVDVVVRSGSAFDLMLEGIARGPVSARVATEGYRLPFTASLDPERLYESWALAYDGASWRMLLGTDTPPQTGVWIAWRGPTRPRGPNPADRAGDVAEQLRALGYVQ